MYHRLQRPCFLWFGMRNLCLLVIVCLDLKKGVPTWLGLLYQVDIDLKRHCIYCYCVHLSLISCYCASCSIMFSTFLGSWILTLFLFISVPGVIGCLQALEAIKIASAVGETLSGRMLLLDALSARIRIVCISFLFFFFFFFFGFFC